MIHKNVHLAVIDELERLMAEYVRPKKLKACTNPRNTAGSFRGRIKIQKNVGMVAVVGRKDPGTTTMIKEITKAEKTRLQCLKRLLKMEKRNSTDLSERIQRTERKGTIQQLTKDHRAK